MKKLRTYNNYISEGSVRDKMTPVDTTDIIKKIEVIFYNARKEEYAEFDSGFYFDVWEHLSENYNIMDNYYVFKGGVYFLYAPTDEYGKYQLTYTYESVNQLKEKMENAIKKMNTLS